MGSQAQIAEAMRAVGAREVSFADLINVAKDLTFGFQLPEPLWRRGLLRAGSDQKLFRGLLILLVIGQIGFDRFWQQQIASRGSELRKEPSAALSEPIQKIIERVLDKKSPYDFLFWRDFMENRRSK